MRIFLLIFLPSLVELYTRQLIIQVDESRKKMSACALVHLGHRNGVPG